MPVKCSNNAQCFCLTKMFEKNASIMYKNSINTMCTTGNLCDDIGTAVLFCEVDLFRDL